ncbi:serine protease [Poseidonocella sp. HB161398]|uniref:S1 family peptidase n=1 Tax=Poseidonocella sp. HB161398 TaxID=2320855 RepID=UPI001108F76A|nr:serine protease [Poseidonocella sp. HB161398]
MRPPAIAALALLALLLPGAASARTDAESARSVVQVRCATADGEMKATGFVWPAPGRIVTALHAVAGCPAGKGFVYSQAAGREAGIARIAAVDLEADLALLDLEDDLGLQPVPFAGDAPDLRGLHYAWGYPLAAAQLIDLRVDFAGGLEGGTTTLGRAFSSGDLAKLFLGQDYPTRDTEILRVTTTLQPGHSGAPIFDAGGRVVAIADGGLLGGWRGINWSIPAHVYLPGLPASGDPVPGAVSGQAALFSAYAVGELKSIPLGAPDIPAAPAAAPAEVLVQTGLLPLPLVLDLFGAEDSEDLSWIVEDLEDILPRRSDWQAFRFAALQSARSGALFFAPERDAVAYDPATGLFEARSIDGGARQIAYFREGRDFETALAEGSAAFFGHLAGLGLAGVPAAVPAAEVDRQLEYIDYEETVGGDDDPAALDLVVQMNGPVFSGRAIYRTRPFEDMSDADYVDFMMMDLATWDLNSLWPLDEEIEAALDPRALAASGYQPEPSALTLVRRVPLADVAKGFVADRNYGWKSDLSHLKSRLADPAEFDALAFDIYEDHATGATVAVPEGIALAWQPDLGAVAAELAGGKVRLAVAVQRAASFRAATGAGASEFLSRLAGYADWSDSGPLDCEMEIDAEEGEAYCWDYFDGTDRGSGGYADLYLALRVKRDVLLASSVYILGEEDDLSDAEVVTYLMTLIGAEYLSDFAAQ